MAWWEWVRDSGAPAFDPGDANAGERSWLSDSDWITEYRKRQSPKEQAVNDLRRQIEEERRKQEMLARQAAENKYMEEQMLSMRPLSSPPPGGYDITHPLPTYTSGPAGPERQQAPGFGFSFDMGSLAPPSPTLGPVVMPGQQPPPQQQPEPGPDIMDWIKHPIQSWREWQEAEAQKRARQEQKQQEYLQGTIEGMRQGEYPSATMGMFMNRVADIWDINPPGYEPTTAEQSSLLVNRAPYPQWPSKEQFGFGPEQIPPGEFLKNPSAYTLGNPPAEEEETQSSADRWNEIKHGVARRILTSGVFKAGMTVLAGMDFLFRSMTELETPITVETSNGPQKATVAELIRSGYDSVKTSYQDALMRGISTPSGSSPAEPLYKFAQGVAGLSDVPENFPKELNSLVEITAMPEGATEGEKKAAFWSVVNTWSGKDAVRAMKDKILNQPKYVATAYYAAGRYLAAASDAYDNGDMESYRRYMVLAADAGRKASQMDSKDPVDFFDETMNIWAEIGFGFIADPLMFMSLDSGIGITGTLDAAAALSDEATKASAEVLNVAAAGGKKILTAGEPISHTKNPLLWLVKRTPRTKAESLADSTYMGVTFALRNVNTYEDARRVISILASNEPGRIITEGVKVGRNNIALGSPVLAELLGDPEAAAVLRIAQPVLDDVLANLAEKTGPLDALDKAELFSLVDQVLTDSAKKLHGVDPVSAPPGTRYATVVEDENGINLVYVGPSGTPVKQVEFSSSTDAAKEAERVNAELKSRGKRKGLNKILYAPSDITRSLMTDLFLSGRPSFWIGNATNAWVTATTDGFFSLAPSRIIDAEMDTILGGRPTRRLLEGAGSLTEMTGKRSLLPGRVGEFADKLSVIWNGETYVPLGIADLPVGEAANYKGIFWKATKKSLRQWDSIAAKDLSSGLVQMGVDPKLADDIAKSIAGSAWAGGIDGVRKAAEDVASKNQITFSPASLGLHPEDLTMDGWKAIQDFVREGHSPEEVKKFVDALIDDEVARIGGMASQAPLEPSQVFHTEKEEVEDLLDYVENVTTTVNRSDLPDEQKAAIVENAKKKAKDLADRTEKARQEVLDVAGQAENPLVSAHMMDLWEEVYDIRSEARMKQGLAAEEALATGNWPAYFQAVDQIYTEANEKIIAAYNAKKEVVMRVAAGEDIPANVGGGWDFVERYLNQDPTEVEALRNLEPGSVQDPTQQEIFKQVIQANRDYTDAAMARLWQVARSNLNEQSVDIMASVERKNQEMARIAIAERNRLLEQLDQGVITPRQYYSARNKLWRDLGTAQAANADAAAQKIIRDKVMSEQKDALTWVTDNFLSAVPGMELDDQISFTLVGPADKSTESIPLWKVVDTFGNVHVIPEAHVPTDVLEAFRGEADAIDNGVSVIEEEVKARFNEVVKPEVDYKTWKFTPLEEEAVGPPVAPKPAEPAVPKPAEPAVPTPAEPAVPTPAEPAVSTPAEPAVSTPAEPAAQAAEKAVSSEATKAPEPKPPAAEEIEPEPLVGYRVRTIDGQEGTIVSVLKPASNGSPRVRIRLDNGKIAIRQGHGFKVLRITEKEVRTVSSPEEIVKLAVDAGVEDLRALIKDNLGIDINEKGLGLLTQNQAEQVVMLIHEQRQGRRLNQVKQYQIDLQYVNQASEELRALEEARQEMLRIWDNVRGNSKDVPPLNTWIMQLGGTGTPDIKIDGVPWDSSGKVLDMLDALGVDSTDGLLEFLNSYKKILDDMRKAQDVIASYKEKYQVRSITSLEKKLMSVISPDYTKMSKKKILEYRGRDLVDWSIEFFGDGTTYSMEELESMSRRDLIELATMYDEWLFATRQADDITLYSFPGNIPDYVKKLLGLGKGEDVNKVFDKVSDLKRAQHVTPPAATSYVNDAAARRLETVRKTFQYNLENLIRNTEGLTAEQVQYIRDWANRRGQLLWNNILDASVLNGKKAADYAMLNYSDRRGFDEVLSLLTPYHFFATRSAKNWAERVINKPGYASQYVRAQRAKQNYHKQQGHPARLSDTIGPIPGTDIYVSDPTMFMFPFSSIVPQKGWDDLGSNPSLLDQYIYYSGMVGLSPFPYVTTAAKLLGGKANQIQPGDYIPQWKLVQQALMAAGAVPAGAKNDEWDPYRVARKAAEWAQAGVIPPEDAQWLQDYAAVAMMGDQPLPEMPDHIAAYFPKLAQETAGDRLLAVAGNFFLHSGFYRYTDAEDALRRGSQTYGERQYDKEENPFGSQTAANQTIVDQPALPSYWSRNYFYADRPEDAIRPGAHASYSDMRKEIGEAYQEAQRKVEALYANNPNATYEEEQAIWDEYNAKKQQIVEAHPSASLVTPGEKPGPNETNPLEYTVRRREELLDFVTYNFPGKPIWPGDNASWEEKQQYYRDREEYKKAQAAFLVENSGGTGLRLDPGESDSLNEARKIIDEYAERNWPESKKEAKKAQAEERKQREEARKQQVDQRRRKSDGTYWTLDEWNQIQADLSGYPYDGTTEEKIAYLRSHPALAAYWKDKYGNAWWERDIGGGGGYRYRGGGQPYLQQVRQPQVYSNKLSDALRIPMEFRGYYMPRSPFQPTSIFPPRLDPWRPPR